MPADPADNVSKVLAAVAATSRRLDAKTLRLFIDELFEWNPRIGLVSKRDPSVVVTRLIHRSIHLWDFVSETLGAERARTLRGVVDIGSGAGFPGLVWKMLNPDLHLVLVERKERKVAFLERVIARARLPDVMAVAADLREFALYESHERSFDLAVMMAVTDPREAAASVERLLRVPGYFCAVRGRDQELPGGSLGLRFQEIARRDTPEGRFVLYEHRQTDDCPAQ